MNKKKLKSFSENVRKILLEKGISNEDLMFKIFTKFIFIKCLKSNNIIINDSLNENEQSLLSSIFDQFFEKDNLNYNTYYLMFNQLDLPEFKDVEEIGWAFQYFQFGIKEKASKGVPKKVKEDSLFAATQVFTPEWIVKYMLNNTLGRLLCFSDTEYLVDKSFDGGIDSLYKLNQIKVLDPCMGTGNILIYAFKLLLRKYQSFGLGFYKAYKNIIINNLYGFEIDKKAFTISLLSFAILGMICSLNENGYVCIDNILDILSQKNIYLINQAEGSLLQSYNDDKIDRTLKMQYDVVCTNPPYMGKKNLNKSLSVFLDENYPLGKADLYSAFILRCLNFTKNNGFLSMITIHSWLFISSYEKLREHIINNYQVESVLHTGPFTFEDISGFNALAVSFIINKKQSFKKTIFIKLNEYNKALKKQDEFYNYNNYYYKNIKSFLDMPGKLFLYYADDRIYELFKTQKKIKDLFTLRQGIATGNNKNFVRYWYEVDKNTIKFDASNIDDALGSGFKYFPYNKGGKYCKWYGNYDVVISFDKKSVDILKNQGNKLPSKKYYFKPGITWSLFGFSNFGVKYKQKGFLFDVSGSTMFVEEKYLYYILGFLSSSLCFNILSILAPTVNFQVGNIANLPVILNDTYLDEINVLVKENIYLCKQNWDNQDLSWDYLLSPLLKYKGVNLQESFMNYQRWQRDAANKLKLNEESLNEIFLKIYNIDFWNKKVNDRDISIKLLDEQIEIKNFINYLIGICLGRYKLEGYKSHNYLNLNALNDEFIKILILLYGKEELNNNLNYLNKIDLNKYLYKDYEKGILSYLMSHFKKCPIYYIINKDNNNYIFNMLEINNVIEQIYPNINLSFNINDGIKENINKLNKFLH